MKRLMVVLLITGVAFSQEIRRPSADSDNSGGQCTSPLTTTGSPTMANAYDASGTATSVTMSASGTGCNDNTVCIDRKAGRVFSGVGSPSAAYSSLTLNVNSSCTSTGTTGVSSSDCNVQYSLNGGGSWTALRGGFWSQLTDTVTLSTSQTLSQIQVRACAEGFGDTNGLTTGSGTHGQANFTAFDIWTSGVIATISNTRTASETVTVTPVLGINKQATLSDTVTVSPAVVAVYGAKRSTPESVGISPAVSYIHAAKSVTSDTATVIDSSVRVAGLHFAISESIGVTPSVLIVFPRFASESVTLTDSIATLQVLKRNFSESVTLSIAGVGSAAGIRAVSESLSISDTSLRRVTLARGVSESGTFTDSFVRKFAYKPGPIEVINLTGIVNLGYAGRPFVDVQVQPVIVVGHTVRPLFSESLTLTPAVIASLPRFKPISEILGLTPTTFVSHAARRFTLESSNMGDVLSSTTINVTPHSEKNTIGQRVTLSEVLVVSVRSSTKKRAVIVMSL